LWGRFVDIARERIARVDVIQLMVNCKTLVQWERKDKLVTPEDLDKRCLNMKQLGYGHRRVTVPDAFWKM